MIYYETHEKLEGESLSLMRRSCKLAASTLNMLSSHIVPGISTEEINTLAHLWITGNGAWPSPLNYGNPPFPKSVCTSVNDCICHGIPGDRILNDGDIVNVDVTTYYPRNNGFHGDTSVTFMVGKVTPEVEKLVKVTQECLDLAISTVKEGSFLWDIGSAIQEHAESNGFSVVKDYVGHGVGSRFHMAPTVLHYSPDSFMDGGDTRNIRLEEGMIFTIEPMINMGSNMCNPPLSDGWTVMTHDGKYSAQFEHTVRVTSDGCEVLTSRE
mgnify:CR=1 FL=1|tara:strand:- start:816 stop:1619 length:804 start_codon:yes stop_codon:yes gene_type:complete